MLLQTGKYNNLSPKLQEKLEKRIESFGAKVRYKLDIGNNNPDPEKRDGDIIYPNVFTLDPVQWTIIDRDENRPGVSKTKNIALISHTEDNDKGVPVPKFIKIRVLGVRKGIIELNLEKEEDYNMCMALEMHPKLKGGDFASSEHRQLVSRIDESKMSSEKSQERTIKLKAMTVAQSMSEKELLDFADAMQWDSTVEPGVLKNQVEQLAEDDPKFFNDLVEGKDLEYRAQVKRGRDKGIISFDPGEYKFFWTGSNQPITQLSPIGEKTENEKLSDWLQIGGQQAEAVYKKLKSLNSGKEKEVAA